MLKEILNEVLEVVNLETQDMNELKGDKLESFRKHIKAKDTAPIYFGLSNLVVLSVDDFNLIKLLPKLETVLKIEVPEYNSFVYVTRYHNNEFLSNLLTVPGVELESL